ncbi:hypothetical protein TCAL_16808 [Tigriopus californicus]|uniref:DUF7041 domain-containing protein n=1 Tax=Tigriopus californicus TaxID=6832 RepID=A0A553PBJ9_TIGCA|nr:hypothetical protein TCAL_16808 [Tigriopus californicus]
MAFNTEEMAAMADVFAAAFRQDSNMVPGGVSTVAVRLPQFLDFNPELWFAQCEAAFELSRVTSKKTKFNHCLAVLEPDVLQKVQSCIRSPDPTNPYEYFKTSLLRATTKPVPQRVQDVMGMRLGDRRPSEPLHIMLEAWPEDNPDESAVSRQLFLQKLPASLQLGLSAVPGLIDDLALLADTQVATLRNLGAQAGHLASAVSLLCSACEISRVAGTTAAPPQVSWRLTSSMASQTNIRVNPPIVWLNCVVIIAGWV